MSLETTFGTLFNIFLESSKSFTHSPQNMSICVCTHTYTIHMYVYLPCLIEFFNWSIGDLQHCVSFMCTAKGFSYTYISIFFRFFSHIEYSFLCYAVGSYQLSILYIVACNDPLQCSCLENPRDGGAWWAAVFGVAQSRTRLKRLSSSSMYMLISNS